MEKTKLFLEKFCEAFIACGLAMVGGDITVLSLNHAIVAGQTGFLAGLAIVMVSMFEWKQKHKNIVFLWATGILTALADLVVHPSNFGGEFTEAIVTGAGAMFCAFMFITIKGKLYE